MVINCPFAGNRLRLRLCEGNMANSKSLSAIDAEIIKSTFQKEVRAKGLPESQWREFAMELVQTYTGAQFVDPDMLEWIIRKP